MTFSQAIAGQPADSGPTADVRVVWVGAEGEWSLSTVLLVLLVVGLLVGWWLYRRRAGRPRE